MLSERESVWEGRHNREPVDAAAKDGKRRERKRTERKYAFLFIKRVYI